MATVTKTPPTSVTLIYRAIGKTHVFTAQEFKGFHIGSSSLRKAYEQAIKALGEHVSLIYGQSVEYETRQTYEAFQRKLSGIDDGDSDLFRSVVIATRSQEARAAAH